MKIKTTKLDRLASKACKMRDKHTCLLCGKTPMPRGLHCAHIEGRRKKSTRWYLPNLLSLCMSCHTWFDEHKGVRDRRLIDLRIRDAADLVYLTIRANETWDKDEYKWQIYLNEKIKEFENG